MPHLDPFDPSRLSRHGSAGRLIARSTTPGDGLSMGLDRITIGRGCNWGKNTGLGMVLKEKQLDITKLRIFIYIYL